METFNVSPNVDMGEYLRQRKLKESLMGGQPQPPEQSIPQIQQAQPQNPLQDIQAQSPPRFHPMQDQFQQMLQQAPNQSDFHPSTRHNIAGILAGVGAGIQQGAQAGIKAHQSITDKPYEDAKSAYQDKLKSAQGAYNFENDTADFERKQQEGFAHMREYDALAGYHKAQADKVNATPVEYKPSNEEEAIRLNQSKLKDPTPWVDKHISTDQSQGLNTMQRQDGSLYNVPYAQPKPVEDKFALFEKELALKTQKERGLIQFRESLVKGRAKNIDEQVDARDLDQAEKLAAKHLYEEHPEFHDFIDPKTGTILPGSRKPVTHWYSKDTGEEKFEPWDKTQSVTYKQVLAEHKKVTQKLLGKDKNKKFSFADDNYEVTMDK